MKTGKFNKVSSNLWVNDYTGYTIEYREHKPDQFGFVVVDKYNCFVWEFEDLKSSKIASKEHYLDSITDLSNYSIEIPDSLDLLTDIDVIEYKGFKIIRNSIYYNNDGKIKGYIILDQLGRNSSGILFNSIKACKKAINDEIRSVDSY
jgi:hypothetical protein